MTKPPDSYDYVLYIDEAGDDVLKNLRPGNPTGASEWLVLAGYLVRAERDRELPRFLADLRSEIGAVQAPTLHYRNLSPAKRTKACELLARGSARAFAVCSFKRTMIGHKNDRAEASSGSNSQYFYNWMVRLLLERATEFCFRDGLADQNGQPRRLKVIFSKKGGHHFGRLKAYIETLKMQAVGESTFISTREIRPNVLRFNLVEHVPGYLLAGLQMADIVASSFFEAVETNRAGWRCEPAVSLSPIMASEVITAPSGIVRSTKADFGVTLVPRPHKAGLDNLQREIFRSYGYIFDDLRRFR